MDRRLAAILAADVVGYSKHMAADESGTLKALKAHREELFDPLVTRHKGRIVKLMGDGVLVEFGSVVDAVTCALAVQTALSESASDTIRLRIGINLGDVIIDQDDIYGDGVNVAARLEGLANPGGICISSIVHESLGNRLDVTFRDAGTHEVKNIDRPIHVYRWDSDETASDSSSPTASPGLAEKPSIAVLPFTNLSGDPEQEFFADGMAEDIITALSKMRWFLVIAHNSTFTYKGKGHDVRQIARELGVRYVLEGSLRKAGNQIRIAAQLIDGATGSHLWAERYDRQVTDIFEVQDDITQKVVRAIEPQLYAAEHRRIESVAPESLDAWACVIRGLWHLGRYTGKDTEEARQLLRQAVALSPTYAKAHSVLAFAEARMAFFGSDMDSVIATARPIAARARELDDDDPWGYFATGYIECFTGRYDDAIAWYRRAIELNENFALAHGNMAVALAFGGQPEAAIEAVECSLRMSPRDPFNFAYLHFAGVAYFAAERYAEGVACEEKALRERANFAPALRCLAACHVGLGQLDKAREVIAEVLRLAPESSIRKDAYGQVAYAREEDRERFASALRDAGLPEA